MRAVGVLAERLQCPLNPAVKAREQLLARLEHCLGDEPGTQVGGRLADVMLIERLVTDRDLAGDHPA